MSRAAAFFLVCLAISFWWLLPAAPPPSPGEPAADGSFRLARYRIRPLQAFQLDALVLGREDYRFGREAELSPTDLALGWGPLGDPALAARIVFSQGNRWYFWHAEPLPLPRREIETHSANMHLIPADAAVARTLAAIRRGERIHLSGELVQVIGDDGWRWTSSLSREDTGAGACELIWVQGLSIDGG